MTIADNTKKKIDSTTIFGFVTFLPCLVHLSLVTITIIITMLYRIILPKLAPFGDIDICANAGAVCTERSAIQIMITNDTRISVRSFA